MLCARLVAPVSVQTSQCDMHARDGAGTATLEAILMASVLGKWGKQRHSVALPAVAASNEQSVQLNVICYVRKVVW